jgi:hypothetical protein
MDDNELSMTSARVRAKQYDQTAESIFILPALELHFQTRQFNGRSLVTIAIVIVHRKHS